MMPLLRFVAALDQACRLADEIAALPLNEVRETLILGAPEGLRTIDIATMVMLIDGLQSAQDALGRGPLPGASRSVIEAELRRREGAVARIASAQDDGDPSRTVFGQGVC